MNGIINVYKEQDYTSFDVVAKLRGILKMKRIGHTGTLDPMAEGVLQVCLGSATKLCEMLTDHEKVYETVMLLGTVTDTQDITGEIISSSSDIPDEETVIKTINGFVGELEQTPPMYSAKKVNGQKLVDLARRGIEVERKKTRVTISDIEILEMNLPRVKMRITCSKGTYIRTLCHDIGQQLGCGASMEKLLRTRVGDFELDTAMRLSEIEAAVKDGSIEDKIRPVEDVFKDAPKIVVCSELCRFIYNGNKLTKEDMDVIDSACYSKLRPGDRVRVYDCNEKFVGVYFMEETGGALKPYKMFLEC